MKHSVFSLSTKVPLSEALVFVFYPEQTNRNIYM